MSTRQTGPIARDWPVRVDDRLTITLYLPRYRECFARLNLEWLERYFRVEPVDRRVLDDPEGQILAPGGEILFALLDDEAVGTVALLPHAEQVFELTKMAVAPGHQGRGLGRALLNATLDRARERAAQSVILYSNTLLEPAIALYRSIGFAEVALQCGEDRYARSNIKMIRDDLARR
jgi:ribosomal protein S18 acetylase RimI-like enzyme